MDIGSIFYSLLVTLNSKNTKLARNEFLVVLVGICSLLAFFLNAIRLRTKSSAVKYFLLVFDAISLPLLSYTVGLLQNFSEDNDLFVIWGVLLYTCPFESDYVTTYGVPEIYARRTTELRDMFLTYVLGNLNGTLGHDFKALLWILWALRPVQIITRIYFYDKVLRSYSHGRNSEFITEYLKLECSNQEENEVNPTTMAGYRFFVWGENKNKTASDIVSRARTIQDAIAEGDCITLEKIWQSPEPLLHQRDEQNRIKDVCLSYALYKILRCQIDGMVLTQKCYDKMQKLIFRGVLGEIGGAGERLFRIFAVEMAFLNDYNKTRYPIVIWYGFPIVNIFTLLVTLFVALFLAIELHNIEFDDGAFTHVIGKFNVDRFIAYVLLFIIVVKELWEIILYTFSDWMKIRIVCKHLNGHNLLCDNLAYFLCTKTIVKSWCCEMSQYNILESFNYKPWFIRSLHYASLHMISNPADGSRLLENIKIFPEVENSIAEALRFMKIPDPDMSNLQSIYMEHIRDKSIWKFSQETIAHHILVWHIATSICEVQLSKSKKNEKQENFWYFSPLCWIRNMCSRKPFLVDLESLEGDLKSHYIVANSISRYCAYLLVSIPELLPHNKIVTEIIFESTISRAREVLKSCDSLESIGKFLMDRGEELAPVQVDAAVEGMAGIGTADTGANLASVQGDAAVEEMVGIGIVDTGANLASVQGDASVEEMMGIDHIVDVDPRSAPPVQGNAAAEESGIVEMGAKLGFTLMELEDKVRWGMLSQYWSNLLLYLAPSVDSTGHQNQSAKGGEFITLLWALFCHCGVFKRDGEEQHLCACTREEARAPGPNPGDPIGEQMNQAEVVNNVDQNITNMQETVAAGIGNSYADMEEELGDITEIEDTTEMGI